MKYLFFLLVLMTYGNCYAQTDTVAYFVNLSKKKCDPKDGLYYRRIFKEGDWWHVMDYYAAESTLEMSAFYAVKSEDTFTMREGKVIRYYPNGKLQETAQYMHDKIVGIQRMYNEQGMLTDSAFFKKGLPARERYKWDSSGNVIFKGVYDEAGSGAGEEWEYFADGKLMSYGKTIAGYLKDSTWKYYYNSGAVSSIEKYERDSLTGVQCFEENGAPAKGKCMPEKMPEPKFSINKYLGENMVYPDEARKEGIEGSVYVQFIVNEDGSIGHVKSVGRHLGGGCEQEAIRVVSSMPKWEPGKSHNRPVKVYYTQPISFRFED